MTWAFIVSWIILALGLAIVTFGDEVDFYRGGKNSKMYQTVSCALHKFYNDPNIHVLVMIVLICVAIACIGLAFII